jgi:1-acyl-sn-glycerol-3-phosphate acyltransferase
VEPWYRLAVLIIRPLMWLLFRHDFAGREQLRRNGGCIVAVNHISYVDPFAVALFVHTSGRRPRFMAKHSVFRIPLLGRIVSGARQIPVFRETADAGKALSAAVAAVENGQCVVIYPEATVTKDPDLWPMAAKTGVARLALMTGAPVIPVGQWGAQAALGLDKRPHLFPRKTLSVHAGPPVDLTRWNGAEPTAEVLRAVTGAVMREVSAIVGELRGETPPEEPFVPRPRPVDVPDERRSA